MDKNRKVARSRLDERFSNMKPIEQYSAPSKGWTRAIRDALGMTIDQLAKRLGVHKTSVYRFEKSEGHGTIQLKTLRKIAESLDCTLVYALVPNDSLSERVETRARAIANETHSSVRHTMSLEDQEFIDRNQEEQINEYIRENIRDRDLWE